MMNVQLSECSTNKIIFIGIFLYTHFDHTELYEIAVLFIGGGLFFECEDFGRISKNSFPACTFFFFL